MITTVKDLMTKDVITVGPETSLISAANKLIETNVTGLPVVVDDNKKLIGLFTEYDLIIKGTTIHLPTFMNLLQNFHIYKEDSSAVAEDIKKILSMRVSEVMNRAPFTLSPQSSVEEAVWVFKEHPKINPIPVIDENRRLVGILARFDIVKLFHGSSAPQVSDPNAQTAAAVNVNNFLRDFEKNFVAVSKTRTRYWLIASVLFAAVGFLIAFLIILRISV